ncbi:hypothetical protein [Escherichia phage ULINTec4]|uniref:Uncharacterized protein n=1 Tax=Escherichia phage ULINTec4 TaxID=2876729 RepID=A0AAE8Y2G5_9CAUD|nr:hypothetical protein [Escherichia phage ULINTec4]
MYKHEIYTACNKSAKVIIEMYKAECQAYNLNDGTEMFYLQFESKLSHKRVISSLNQHSLDWEEVNSNKL